MNIFYEKQSNSSQELTINKLKEKLLDVGFGVLWEINFKNKFEEKGLDYSYDFWIFEVCNPKLAIDVLGYNQKAGYMLPCKMSVYESENGLFVGFTKPSVLIGLLDESDELKEVATKVEMILKGVIDSVVMS
tara:strand:+ start:261 stop:656 length:396 start_codon:yes stop_codon:yes gene_type:complete